MRASKRNSLLTALFAVAGMAGCSPPAAQQAAVPSPSPVAEPAPTASAASPKAASGEELAWLAGSWCGNDEGQRLEETWFVPAANEAIGMSRTLSGGRMIAFEFMRIMQLEGAVTFIAQPGGDPPTSFSYSDGGDDWIRFENKEHDYPQRIEYRREGDGLTAEIGGPGAGGKEEVLVFSYTRCPAS
jgi:hypothetical protein